MKKGRPGLVLSALARRGDAVRIADAVLEETTSLGARVTLVSRTERPRAEIVVETPFGAIPVKVSGGAHGAPVVKPEFDACARAARVHGVPTRVVVEAAAFAARSIRTL
jgi:uncharacterized protein (DUF111 family)